MQNQTDSPLDNLLLSYSCPVAWSSMTGDERERLCRQCDKKVYNISDMTTSEANAFLVSKQEESICYNFYLREDGTIKTDNCPKVLRPIRDRLRWAAQACSLLLTAFCSVSEAIGYPQSIQNKSTGIGRFQGSTGIGGGLGNPNGLRLLLLPTDSGDLKDKELIELKNAFYSKRTLSQSDFDKIENFYNRNGMIAKAFLVRQSKLRHFSSMADPTEREKNLLELERAKVINELIDTANKMHGEDDDDQAVKELESCIKVSQDPYNRLMTAIELPPGIERVSFNCSNETPKILILSAKSRIELLEVLEKLKPKTAHALNLKNRMMNLENAVRQSH
ncbi:MAG: hypothetical protein KIT34_09945 [Cyanobacteria bacterium TGS_CYA1]|nr:hypothetical protein [Cyanobacteria bacterium TGS_CYA1]